MTTPSAPRSASSTFLLAMANHAVSLGAEVSLHTSDPQDTGVAEVTGGRYARQTTVWAAAAYSGGIAASKGSDCVFSVPANTGVTHFGVWNAGVFQYGAALDAPVHVGSGGDGLVIVSPRYEELPGDVSALTLFANTVPAGAAGTVTTVAAGSVISGGTP